MVLMVERQILEGGKDLKIFLMPSKAVDDPSLESLQEIVIC